MKIPKAPKGYRLKYKRKMSFNYAAVILEDGKPCYSTCEGGTTKDKFWILEKIKK